MSMNLTSLLWAAAERWPDAPFLQGQQCYSYRQARLCVNELAEQFTQKGVCKGDRVLVLAENRPESVLALFAASAIGAVTVLLHETSTQRTLQAIVTETEPTLVCLDALGRSQKGAFGTLPMLAIDQIQPKPLPQAMPDPNLPLSMDGREPVFIIYTSGSTGKPRGVVLSHGNVLFVTDRIQRRLAYQSGDRVGLFLPLSFDYGLYQAFLCASSGAQLLFCDSTEAGPGLVRCLETRQITVLPGVPNLLSVLLRVGLRRQQTITSVRLVTNTGAHLPATHMDQLQLLLPNAGICPMYGLTECKRIAILTPREASSHSGSVGRVLEDTRGWLVNEQGQALEEGEVGELVVTGPHVAQGYWAAPEETALRFRRIEGEPEPVLFTGDLFRRDSEGYLYFVRRKDDQIKRQGFRINPLEIEQAAMEIQGVINASVVFVRKQLVMYLVSDEDDLTEQSFMRQLAVLLEPHKLPDRVERMVQLPTTRNGKIDRRALEEHCHA